MGACGVGVFAMRTVRMVTKNRLHVDVCRGVQMDPRRYGQMMKFTSHSPADPHGHADAETMDWP